MKIEGKYSYNANFIEIKLYYFMITYMLISFSETLNKPTIN